KGEAYPAIPSSPSAITRPRSGSRVSRTTSGGAAPRWSGAACAAPARPPGSDAGADLCQILPGVRQGLSAVNTQSEYCGALTTAAEGCVGFVGGARFVHFLLALAAVSEQT